MPGRIVLHIAACLYGGLACAAAAVAGEGAIWWEAEAAAAHTFPASNAFAPATAAEKDKLSGGAWLQTHQGAGVTARWRVSVPQAGTYNFWTRKFWKHGPFEWRWNQGAWQACGRDCALADSVELRKHVCANWVYLGKVELPAGESELEIRAAQDAQAIAFDCWVLARGVFTPDGRNRPGAKYDRADEGWFAFEPDADAFSDQAFFDLRGLNQSAAGADGFVQARGTDFVFAKTGARVKFWAVNNSCDYDDRAQVDFLARKLAKMGVNLVRFHGPVFDRKAADPAAVDAKVLDKLHYAVAAFAKQGIYAKLSFYFPLWFDVKPGDGLPGYEGQESRKPFALLFFHPRMQAIYKAWARALLATKNPYTGRALGADPAVAIVEIVNEDNYFFWTFKPGKGIPAACMGVLETRFGTWLAARYGSLAKAKAAWGAQGTQPADDVAAGRVGLYEAGLLSGQSWAVNQRNARRAQDTARFLTEDLRAFYAEMARHFREDLGVGGCISATNWKTCDPRVLGALDKYANAVCDVMDRHAYFGGPCEGADASYAVRRGHVYADRTGLRGPESLTPELEVEEHPHLVSEYSYPMPNRFRTECVWLTATYGSLAGTDGFVFFSNSNADWMRTNAKWPVCTPAVMGQFPAAALAFRQGYVQEGPVVSRTAARLEDLYALKGTPVAEAQNLDALRAADIPPGGRQEVAGMQAVDPLAFYVGPVTLRVAEDPGRSLVRDLRPFIDRQRKLVTSATGELAWDWGRGVVVCRAPRVQGACGFLAAAGSVEAGDLRLALANEYAAVLAVSLDKEPLAKSRKILLQVMTEDQNFGWTVEPAALKDRKAAAAKAWRITDLGGPPLEVRRISGTVALKHADAASLRVTALDANGLRVREVPVTTAGGALRLELLPDCLYYGIETRVASDG